MICGESADPMDELLLEDATDDTTGEPELVVTKTYGQHKQ